MSINTGLTSAQNALITDTTPVLNVARYDGVYKLLHWLIAGLMLLMLLAKFGFASAITVQDKITMLIGHSSIGSILALLILVRVMKRFIIGSKRPVQNIATWQRKVSGTVQLALYFCMLMIPTTGYLSASLHKLPVMPFTLVNLSQVSTSGYDETYFLFMRSIHENLIDLLIALLLVHIGAALFHRFIKKDDVMSSMTPGK